MSRETTIIIAGIWIIVLPLLGFPETWRIVLFIITGLGLVALGLFLRAQLLGQGRGRGSTTYTESRPALSDIHAHDSEESLNSFN